MAIGMIIFAMTVLFCCVPSSNEAYKTLCVVSHDFPPIAPGRDLRFQSECATVEDPDKLALSVYPVRDFLGFSIDCVKDGSPYIVVHNYSNKYEDPTEILFTIKLNVR